MIITQNTSPKRNLYYLGAKLLTLISNSSLGVLDFMLLFEQLKKEESEEVPFDYFLLSLDWLFLLDLIETTEHGDIKRCF